MAFQLFADNFKGFFDTRVPLTTANFLVGENSTGKTAILSLFTLLAGSDLLMRPVGDSDFQGLGHFEDIAHTSERKRTQFTVGITSDSSRDGSPVGYFLTFSGFRGQARLRRCIYRYRNFEIALECGSHVAYRFREAKPCREPLELFREMRKDWVGAGGEESSGDFKRLGPTRAAPLGALLAVALHTATSGKTDGAWQFNWGGLGPEVVSFAPIRSQPKRTYDESSLPFSPEGSHTPYLIRRMLRSRKQREKLTGALAKIGAASGLFEGVKTPSFGSGAGSRFELDVLLSGRARNVLNVGYGVSQVLPIIVELVSRPHGATFAIQEPEIHLHPRAQAAFGDLLFEMATKEHKSFLVETHSDYLVDRFRLNYRGTGEPPGGQVLFFRSEGGRNTVTSLQFTRDGELPSEQPKAFRDFFVREEMRILGIS
ncbi:MAG TPA: AAA family ATPase [Terriglobales bacterium]